MWRSTVYLLGWCGLVIAAMITSRYSRSSSTPYSLPALPHHVVPIVAVAVALLATLNVRRVARASDVTEAARHTVDEQHTA
ncbi:MAG: hypothetical protein KIS87_11745 [Phycisphaeraceae bacterium]|nr:hypothetical protein [Phycisphaeraceae bacterium]